MIKHTTRRAATSLVIALLVCAPIACAAPDSKQKKSEELLVSSDCKTWKKPSSVPTVGYVKQGDSISYMDFQNRLYVVLETKNGDPFVFDYSTPGWINMISERNVESMRADLELDADKIGSLTEAIMMAGANGMSKSRWIVMSDRGSYFAFFTNKKCSSAPQAWGAHCRIGKTACELVPKENQKKPGDAEGCLKELGFASGELRESLEKACETYNSKATAERVSSIVSKSQLCPNAQPIQVKIKTAGTCSELPALFANIEKKK